MALLRALVETEDQRAAECDARAEAERAAAESARQRASRLRAQLAEAESRAMTGDEASAHTWRERLWTCPPQTRLGVKEVAEALGCSRSQVYHAITGDGDLGRIPYRKRDNRAIEFIAGEVRSWVLQTEVIGQAGALATSAERVVRRPPPRRRNG